MGGEVKPWVELGRGALPGGAVLSLHRRDGELVIRADGQELMSNRRHGSEEALAERGCAGCPADARVLVGGLGMGFTLQAALTVVGPAAEVTVAELSPEVVAWNRELLGAASAAAVADRRVTVHVGDVVVVIAAARARFDAILLDVDNSPHALGRPGNAALYSAAGLAATRRALRRGGRVAVWSASEHPEFARRLERAGFAVDVHLVRARGAAGGMRHVVYAATPR